MTSFLSALRTGLLRPRRLSGSQSPPALPPKPSGRARAFTFAPSSSSRTQAPVSTPTPLPTRATTLPTAPVPLPATTTTTATVTAVSDALQSRASTRRKPTLAIGRLGRLTVRRKPGKMKNGKDEDSKPPAMGLKREKTIKPLRGMGVFVVTTVEEIYEQALVPFSGPSQTSRATAGPSGSHSRRPSAAGPSSYVQSRPTSSRSTPKRASTMATTYTHSRKNSALGHGRNMSSSSIMKGDRRASLGLGTKRFSNMVNRRTSQQLYGALNLLEFAAPPAAQPVAPEFAPTAEPLAPVAVVAATTPEPAPVIPIPIPRPPPPPEPEPTRLPAPPSAPTLRSLRSLIDEKPLPPRPVSSCDTSVASIMSRTDSIALSEAGRRRLMRLESRSASRLTLATRA